MDLKIIAAILVTISAAGFSAAQNVITLPDDGTTRTNLGDDSILEYGYTTAPGATMLFEVWKKQPSSGIANKANNGSFNVMAAWRGRAEPVGQASLKLFSVTKDEAGQYQLSTTFSDGTSDSKERTLIVQYAPEDTIVTAAPGLIAKEGDAQVVLTCQSGGIPAPTYTWTGDNLPADAAQDPNTGTLTITNIQRSAAGQYTCTADNGVPQLPGDNPTALTNSVNVQVQYGPSSATISRDPADKVVQWSTVTLSCAVDTANPPAIYTWTRVNGTLPTNTDVDQIAGTLRLRSIQPDAVGTYQCSATNRIGDPAVATHVIDEVEEVHNDKCYRQSRDALSHNEASAACVFMGGQLVDIKQSHEQQMLTDIIRNTNDVSHWTFIKSETPTLLHIDGSPMSLQSSWMAEDMYGPFDICVLLDRDQSYKGDFHACTEQHNYVCESSVTPCHPDVCQHGGICKSCFSESPMCDCPPGNTGVFCETDLNECASNPCQNGGTCLDRVNSYVCACRIGFDGDLCENDIDYCDPNPCPASWTCVDQVVGFHCEVPHGAKAASTFCMASPCGPGWTCEDTGLRTGYNSIPVS